MNYLSFIVPPVVGAVIGYSTNWIAVKMLFRPLNPVKIGKFTLPFTPGLIPKSKPRLAKALGEAVSTNLLSNEDIIKSMLSNDVVNSISEKIEDYLNKEDSTLKNIISSCSSEESFQNIVNLSADKLSDIILDKLKDKNLGKLISAQIQEVAGEKLKGSLLGFFGGNSIISSLGEPVENAINDYINSNGKSLLEAMCKEELEKLSVTSFNNIITSAGFETNSVANMLSKLYIEFINKKMNSLLENLNISKIVENKILEMDLLELENLILSVMKNELKALVNLGALIGFLLGIINIWF